MSDVAHPKPLSMKGLYPATITPFKDDFSVDYDSLHRHLEETASAQGVSGIVVNAGLAEILQLTSEEKTEIIRLAKKIARPDQIVVSGIEGRSALQATQEGQSAKEAGADALLVLPAFDVRAYRRLAKDVDSVKNFFGILDRDIDLPMIVFQYPDASGVSYSLDALVSIASLKNIVGIKVATPLVTRYVQVWEALHDQVAILAAADSPPLLGMLLHGAHGALIGISVIGAEKWVELVHAVAAGETEKARHIHSSFCVPLMEGVFENQEPTSPTSEVASVKEALVQLGQIKSSRVREPAVGVTEHHRACIQSALKSAGLLPG